MEGLRWSAYLAARIAAYSRDPRLRPWARPRWRPVAGVVVRGHQVACNICGWHGTDFRGTPHSESATCPRCGSVARDRFLYHCWTRRVPHRAEARVLETSPRLGGEYRQRMGRLVEYLASDYDERAHRADIHLDLQDMDLPDAGLDVILTPHVLEHVPDTQRALAEMRRVLKPGGVAIILVPVPQGRTAPPEEPEFHADDTPVCWRFGWDLTDKLRDQGFETSILVTEEFLDRARTGAPWDVSPGDVNANQLVAHAGPYIGDMVPIASTKEVRWLGLEPSYYFIAWEARKPR